MKEIEKFLLFENTKIIYELAGRIKRNFPISLADCYTIATGIKQNCPTLFLEEKEISQGIANKINKKFKSKLYVIDMK